MSLKYNLTIERIRAIPHVKTTKRNTIAGKSKIVVDNSIPKIAINKKNMINSIPIMYKLVKKDDRGKIIFGIFNETIIDFLLIRLFMAWLVPLEKRCTIIRPLKR